MSASSSKSGSSRLFYHGTNIEVRLGDRVEMKRFLRRPRRGVVYYIPGQCPKHPELEYEDVRQWAIRADDGATYPILYDPDNFQPPGSIIFLGRSDEPGLQPDEVLDEWSEDCEE